MRDPAVVGVVEDNLRCFDIGILFHLLEPVFVNLMFSTREDLVLPCGWVNK